MKCDECDKPHAKKYFINWLCPEHGKQLLTSVGWLKPKPTFTKPCECGCHPKFPFNWCDDCWNNKEHGLQTFPIKAGMIREDGTTVRPEDVSKSWSLQSFN